MTTLLLAAALGASPAVALALGLGGAVAIGVRVFQRGVWALDRRMTWRRRR